MIKPQQEPPAVVVHHHHGNLESPNVHRIIHMIQSQQEQQQPPAVVVHHHHGSIQNPSGVVHVLQHPVMPSTHKVIINGEPHQGFIIHGDQVGEESTSEDESNSSEKRAAFRKRLLPKIRERLKGKKAVQTPDSHAESMKNNLHNVLIGDEKYDA